MITPSQQRLASREKLCHGTGMPRAAFPLWLLLTGCFALLAGCTSPSSPNAIMDRVEANRAEYETWPYEIKDAVLSGQVQKGMTSNMVTIARGQPSEKKYLANNDEVWVYRRASESSDSSLFPAGTSVSVGMGGGYPSTYPGTYPSGNSGISTGVYLPPIVLGGGGNSSPLPYEDNEDTIVFRDGRVIHGVGVK